MIPVHIGPTQLRHRHCRSVGPALWAACGTFVRILLGTVACTLILGCTQRQPQSLHALQNAEGVRPAQTHERRIEGDREDLTAAIRWAARQQEWVIASWSELPDGGRRYQLMNTRDEPGWVECRDVDAAAGKKTFSGFATAGLGRFGNPARERALIKEIADRLTVLSAKRK